MEENIKTKVYKPSAVLIAFHGTITSVKWEDEVVYPFVDQELPHFLSRHRNETELNRLIRSLREESLLQKNVYLMDDVPLIEEDAEDENALNSVVMFIRWQNQRKNQFPATLSIQRMVWEEGFENGLIKYHVYPDVRQALQDWTRSGIKVFVDSPFTNNETANLLKRSIEGDLSSYISGCFGSEYGPRSMCETYANIVKAIGLKPSDVLLVTHSGQRAKTGSEVNLEALLVVRKENRRIREYYLSRFRSVLSLKSIQFVSKSK